MTTQTTNLTILNQIKDRVKPYILTKRDKRNKEKQWHWQQDWAKAELLLLGRKLRFDAVPEYPCENPGARSKRGRIDVVWLNSEKPAVAIEISKGMPSRRDLSKLIALKGAHPDCLVVVVTMSRSKIWSSGGKKRQRRRPNYRGLDLTGEIWVVPAGGDAVLLKEWLQKHLLWKGNRLVEPVFNKKDGLIYA